MKNIRIFYLEIFPFLLVKFSIYLNRRVFVMYTVLARSYTRANTKSYDNLGDKIQGVQEYKYFAVLTGPISYGINQSMRFY